MFWQAARPTQASAIVKVINRILIASELGLGSIDCASEQAAAELEGLFVLKLRYGQDRQRVLGESVHNSPLRFTDTAAGYGGSRMK